MDPLYTDYEDLFAVDSRLGVCINYVGILFALQGKDY